MGAIRVIWGRKSYRGLRGSRMSREPKSLMWLEVLKMGRRFAGSIVAVLAFSPMMLAQTSKPSEAEKTQAAPPALSHDLSGVWMQYPSGAGPGVPGMNARR